MKFAYKKFNFNQFETHKLVYDLIHPHQNILDLGCATGYFAKELKKKKCRIWGVEKNPKAAEIAKQYCEYVYTTDLENEKSVFFRKSFFDIVLLLDVIEHLTQPEVVLKLAKKHLRPKGQIIISTPNIAHASMRYQLLKGSFKYKIEGILDMTHLHFYTRETFKQFLAENDLALRQIIYSNGMTKVPFFSKITDRLSPKMQHRIVQTWPTLFAYQFIAICKKI